MNKFQQLIRTGGDDRAGSNDVLFPLRSSQMPTKVMMFIAHVKQIGWATPSDRGTYKVSAGIKHLL